MRIAHITDTHLGYRSSTVQGREEDFAKAWIEACHAIIEDRPDLIIHSGDVFHRPHPSWGAVSSFVEGAKILQTANCPILGITGNHDSPRLQMKSTVFSVLAETTPWIHLANDKEPELISLPELNVEIVLLPHPALLNPLLSKRMYAIEVHLDSRRTNILVAHGDIKTSTRGEGEELGSIAIPERVFEFDWDYCALGHLHLAQPFGRNGWYAGSIERCGWSDFPASPAWSIVRLEKGKTVTHTQRPLEHKRFVLLPELSVQGITDVQAVNEIIKSATRAQIEGQSALVRVVLEDAPYPRLRTLERSVRESFRKLFPETILRVDFKKDALPKEVEERELRNTTIIKSIPEMFKDYVNGRLYPIEGQQERILAGGLAALEKANGSLTDSDTGDERTPSRG